MYGGGGGGPPQKSNDTNLSISGRLAHCSIRPSHLATSGSTNHSMSTDIGLSSEFSKIQTNSDSIASVHRSTFKNPSEQSVPTRGQEKELKIPVTAYEMAKKGFCSSNSNSVGPYVGSDIHSAKHQTSYTPTAVGFETTVVSTPSATITHDNGHITNVTRHQLVVTPKDSHKRFAVQSTSTQCGPNYRCITYRIGSPSRPFRNTGPLVTQRIHYANQSPGTSSHTKCFTDLPSTSTGQKSHGLHRQSSCHVLHKQARRVRFVEPLQRNTPDSGMDNQTFHTFASYISPRSNQHQSRPSQQGVSPTRMGTPPRGSRHNLPEVGHSFRGPLRHRNQQEGTTVLLLKSQQTQTDTRCFPPIMDQTSHVRIPTDSTTEPNNTEMHTGPSRSHTDSPSMAETTMVLIPAQTLYRSSHSPWKQRRSSLSGRRHSSSPDARLLTPNGVLTERDLLTDMGLSTQVQDVLIASRKPSTRKNYYSKWHRYTNWCTTRQLNPRNCTPKFLMDYLYSLYDSGLATASIRVHLSAIAAFHLPVNGKSVSTHPLLSHFMIGLSHLRPPLSKPRIPWDLNVVLEQLMLPPFEPMEVAHMKYLTWKVVFLVAITSARRVSELQALVHYSPYLKLFQDRVVLRTHPSLLPKIVSAFHLNQDIVLPTFSLPPHQDERHQSLHTLDCKRALRTYLQRTSTITRPSQLFLTFNPNAPGLPVAKRTISAWIIHCIKFCYEKRNLSLASPPHAHQVRALSTSIAHLQQVTPLEICRAATWSSVHTFTEHYCIKQQLTDDTTFGRAVLNTIIH
ncbi:uncharacterized protein LOC115084588 [Rhinatrema bivittatum]|uniref:uncharacterized protein LOC115084588 n=1 Tax=Rhinatrema bivittatum TaxID=194408 RepID=UPI0011268D58|nr:uncharacterized protein LOC115084588 [Rhinatrema bivittatum]